MKTIKLFEGCENLKYNLEEHTSGERKMKNKRFFVAFALLLVAVASVASAFKEGTAAPTTWIVDDDGPANFSTIQEAINAASNGDSISVRAGTYYECVVVNKSVSLFGEDADTTIIDASQMGDCMQITAHSVRVSDFTIQNGGSRPYTAYACVRVSSTWNRIRGCNLIGSWCGIWFEVDCGYNLIANNTMVDNLNGIAGQIWHDSTIINNRIADNLLGIWIGPYSTHNTISFNDITHHWSEGISMWQSSYNTFEGNNITDNNIAGWATGITIGFQVGASMGNRFFHNNIGNHGTQVYLTSGESEPIDWDDGYPSGGNCWSDYNGTDADGDGIGDTSYVIGDKSTDRYPLASPWGTGTPLADFSWSPDVPAMDETVAFDASGSKPKGGVLTSYTWDFGDGTIITTDLPTATHSYSSNATYMVTLTVEDTEGLSHSVSKSVRVVKHDAAVLEITKSHVRVYEGRSVSVNVTIANLGECTETVNFTLYYQMSTGKKISTMTMVLQPGENAAFSLTWDTTGLPCTADNNTYVLAAQVLPLGIDNDLSNNLLYGGKVECGGGVGRVD